METATPLPPTQPISGRRRLKKMNETNQNTTILEDPPHNMQLTHEPEPKRLKLRLKLGGETTSLLEYDKKPAPKQALSHTTAQPKKTSTKEPSKSKKTIRDKDIKKGKDKKRGRDQEDDEDGDEDYFDLDEKEVGDNSEEEEELLVDDLDDNIYNDGDMLLDIDDEFENDGGEGEAGEDSFDEFSGVNKKLTTRQLAMCSGGGSSLLSLPTPEKKSSAGQALSEEARLKKAGQAERRRQKQQIEQQQLKEMVINQLLNRSAKSKKDDAPVVTKSVLPATERGITYISGVKGNVLIFPENQAIPSFLNQKGMDALPPVSTCAAPNCTNPKRYSCRKTNLPLCSFECYKVVNSMPLAAVQTAK